MRPISEHLLAQKSAIATGDSGEPSTIKTTPKLKRVKPAELELTYLHNPTLFNGINKIVQTVMAASHEIVAEDPEVQEFFRNFVKDLGHSGSDITWEELLSNIFMHQCIYGRAWVENIYNKKGNRIVDWDMIDPKKMDYAKNSNQKIVLDKFGKPIGYFQKIPLGAKRNSTPEEELPDDVALPIGQEAIFLEPKRVAQLKLFTVGDGFYGIGLIEPVYKTSLRKMNIEEALANAIYRHGFPIIWAKLGDLNHEPTPQKIKSILSKLKDINFKQEIATPYYYELKILESKKVEKLREHLDYFREQEISGLGIPKPFATGGADGATHATLGGQSSMFQLTLRDLVNKTAYAIQKYMFAPICKLEGFDEIPELRWDIVGSGELDKKADRIVKYIKAGVLNPDEKIANIIKKAENIK